MGASGGDRFTGETLVHVGDSQGKPALKPIAAIQIGDEVRAGDEMAAHDGQLQQGQKGNTQKIQAKKGASEQQISAICYKKESKIFGCEKERKLVHVTLAGGKSIAATDEHPFRTSEGWRDAILL